jgi:hypothetical protein
MQSLSYASSVHPEKAVFRNLALPVSVFDYIKDVQRRLEARHGNRLSITQVVSQIIREHKAHSTTERPRRSEVQTNVPALPISRNP